ELAVPPLFYADSRDTMNVLLEYGANHLMVPSFGTAMTTTVLQHNLFLDRVGLARLLEDHGCDYALTPLHALAAAGDVAAVQYYMKNGVDPDMLGEYYVGLNQRTPLHWAAVMGRTRVVEALLLHRATVDFTDRMGRTPLHWAARHNQVGAINALLSSHANPICLDDSNMTPLDVGSHSGTLREPAIRSLVSWGSLDINGAYCGDTPLHLALKQGHKEAALALIACGADIYQTNRDGRRAIDCCISAELQYSIKKASGSVDVYISYDPPYYAFAKAVCDSVETNFISVNLRPVLETVYLYTRQIIPFQRSVVVHKSTPTTDPTSRVQLYSIEMNQDVFTQAMRSLLDGLRDEVSDLKERVVAAKDAILQCQLFVVVLSAESILTSLVSDQLAFAEDKGKRIVPICLHSNGDGMEHNPHALAIYLLVDKLTNLFQTRLLVFGDDLGFEHGMDNLVEFLDENVERAKASVHQVADDTAKTSTDDIIDALV
ncbi:hypothetical protein DYB30_011818, partial [Aphanomyces astaci]